jgi:hypothetical protein
MADNTQVIVEKDELHETAITNRLAQRFRIWGAQVQLAATVSTQTRAIKSAQH